MRDIVYVDVDAALSVQSLADKDVIGMPITIEYTLRCAWNTVKPDTFPNSCSISMADDPWLKWALESKPNYEELWNYAMDIVDEHYHRFGSRGDHPYKHGSLRQLELLGVIPPLEGDVSTQMPTSVDDARDGYKAEVAASNEVLRWCTFTHRETPEWLK